MKRVVAERVEGTQPIKASVNLTHVRFEWGELVVTLTSGEDKKVAIARFPDIAGFRMLDEGDLLEFWPTCAQGNGWLFRIHQHGWLELESSRAGFIRADAKGLQEYFFSSQNGCLSVLAYEAPHVEMLSI